MKERAVTAIMLCVLAFALAGCAAILEGDTLSTAPRTGAAATAQPGSAPEASNYEELKDALLELVSNRAESGQVIIYSYEGDIFEDVVRACDEIKTTEPLGAYALADITASATQFVSYFEVDAELSYKRTRTQIDAIIEAQRQKISTLRYFRSELLSFMSEYADEAIVFTDVRDITDEEVREVVWELYYENPLSVVMMPSIGVEIFPPDAQDGERLFELTFGYQWQTDLLAANNRRLKDTVSLIAAAVSGGDNDGMILLELAQKLADSCVYNEVRAATIAEHGGQNFEATAYGALCDGRAVGEGFAMAFKALCDELGFECSIVLGTLGGAAHAWNIVALEGDYYHVDVAMCSKNGIETAFLLRDADLQETHQWDRQSAKSCEGELTYQDFAVMGEEDALAEAGAQTGAMTDALAGADEGPESVEDAGGEDGEINGGDADKEEP